MEEQKLYDLAFLNKVSGGDGDFIREMISTFNEVGPEYVEKSTKLLEADDFDTLGKETHRMIPGVTFLGAKALEGKLMLIEEYTKKNTNLTEIPGLLSDCKKMIFGLIDEFEKDFG